MMMNRLAALLLLCVLASITPAEAQFACPDPYDNAGACAPVTASATDTTGATTATLPAAAGKTTYICGFYFSGTNATAANPATAVTVTGAAIGTMTFGFPTLAAGATVPNTRPINPVFTTCIAASASNTAITVTGPALGAGATQATLSAWGYNY
jgi:hypothetical protein